MTGFGYGLGVPPPVWWPQNKPVAQLQPGDEVHTRFGDGYGTVLWAGRVTGERTRTIHTTNGTATWRADDPCTVRRYRGAAA